MLISYSGRKGDKLIQTVSTYRLDRCFWEGAMPELKRATEDIASAIREFEVQRERALRFRRQLAATDGLLDMLEGMNLEERECVGTAAARQIARTLELLPPS